jgi:putative nucleotidyltransferase with HDIG domain
MIVSNQIDDFYAQGIARHERHPATLGFDSVLDPSTQNHPKRAFSGRMLKEIQEYRVLLNGSCWTAGHSERVASFAEKIAIELKLSQDGARSLSALAVLHDIGKVALPQQILDKRAPLSDEEFALVRTHPEKGLQIIANTPFPEEVKAGILYHHERWDGSGYPCGLEKRDIPHYARIIAVADVFDSLTYDRPYRKGCSPERALSFLYEKKGVDFDPQVVDIFVSIISQGSDYVYQTS